MGKIAHKKKARPSKADLDCHDGLRGDQLESELRRSNRRRNLTYIDDFYDDEEDDGRGRTKKLKLVLNLNNNHNNNNNNNNVAGFGGVDSASLCGGGGGGGRGEGMVGHGSAAESRGSVAASSLEYGDDDKPFKKRRIDGDDRLSEGDGDADVRSIGSGDHNKKSGQNVDSSRIVSVPGTPFDSPSGVPLPDKKQLELILDKLQKKDTYGVYAEPVDPEELPGYHDVIEHPMDFGTIRKMVERGAYSNLEQFENDVYLVCTNAMLYNAPETIYFKQARSIQELARKKFQRLRIDFERIAAERNTEKKANSNPVMKKPIKKSPCKIVQEPVGSDFSSGATLATVREKHTWANTLQAGVYEWPSNVHGHVDGKFPLTENKPEKTEEQLSGKGCPPKFGRKTFVLDENRRSTYNISNQPMVRTESMFTIFEGENKQLVTVGLHADHSYARSLARFAATLGPFAWKVASRRIEQALPVGFKFGHGWVGEYEPLPTPVLILENPTQKQQDTNLQSTAESKKDDKNADGLNVGESECHSTPVLIRENSIQKQLGPNLQSIAPTRNDGKTAEGLKASQDDVQLGHTMVNLSGVTASGKFRDPAKKHHFIGPNLEGKSALFGVTGAKPIVNAIYQQQNPLLVNFARSENNVLNRVESNCSSSISGNTVDIASQKQLKHGSEMTTSRLLEMVSKNRILEQSAIFKSPENGGVVAGGLPNGKAVSSSSDSHKMSTSTYDSISNQQARATANFPHGNHEGLSDPVQIMRMLVEKTQNQQKSLNPITADYPQVTSSDPSSKRNDSSAAAARAWMTLGAAHFKSMDSSVPPKMQIVAASLHNPAQDLPQSVSQYCKEASGSDVLHLQSEKDRIPPPTFLPQAAGVGKEPWFPHNRSMVFPQLVTTDLSRFRVQCPWRGLSPHTQPNNKKDTLPPDLNIRFQSPGSPVRQPSGAVVDSQIPDLALQL